MEYSFSKVFHFLKHTPPKPPPSPLPPFNHFSSLNCELKFSCNIQYFSEMNTWNRYIFHTFLIMGIDEHRVPKGDDVLP